MTNALLEAALSYAGRPWPVLPLKPGEKVPLTAHGLKDASTNEHVIVRWWDQCEDANIGIATGKSAGVWVLDIDGEIGSQSITALEKELGPLPDTLEQRTGGGGRQLFFRWPDKREVRNLQNLKHRLLPKKSGLDVRGEGGYVVVPPSLHPNGHRYEWPYGDSTPIIDAPLKWLDLVAPRKRRVMPWERDVASAAAPPQPPAATLRDSTVERAILYLAECESAVQGSGGHNALLWASRAMVIGFQFDDKTALGLLWSEFNPRCVPPWDRGNQQDEKDFERKVIEARRTPGKKPAGWLLDEYGLRDNVNAMAQIAQGRQSQESLLASQAGGGCTRDTTAQAQAAIKGDGWSPFPIDCLPGPVAGFAKAVARAHGVDVSCVALPILSVASAAMGSAFRLKAKDGWLVPPTLWCVIVCETGMNKSAPIECIVRPLWDDPPLPNNEDALRAGYQPQWVIVDATTEAVLSRLGHCPRGLLLNADELAQWIQTFDAYRTGKGADQQIWVKLWDVKPYVVNRKTDNEVNFLRAPAVSLIGGIQPAILRKCTDAEKLANGFSARALVAMPPAQKRKWRRDGVTREMDAFWAGIIDAIRIRPFADFRPDNQSFSPNIITLSPSAEAEFIECFNAIGERVYNAAGIERILAAKSDTHTLRLALVLYGLECACGFTTWGAPLSIETMRNARRLGEWFLDEGQRVLESICLTAQESQRTRLAKMIEKKGGAINVRELQNSNSRRYKSAEDARAALSDLAQSERGTFENDVFTLTRQAQ